MKRVILSLLLALVGAVSAHGQATQISSGPADPPHCNANKGLQFYNTTSSTMKYCSATDTWTAFSGGGQTLPNTNLAFSTTPSFDGTINHAYSMTLSANVTSSTVTGTPQNGTLMALNLCQDGTGTHTFAFPPNFTLGGFSFQTGANVCNYVTFKFDGVNWTLVSTGGGGGGTPAGNNGNVQLNNSGAFGVGGENDDGAVFSTTRDSQFAGPNPYIDVRAFGVRAVGAGFSTTGSITSGTNTLTLAAASNFVNGDGINVTGAGATPTITTPSAPTVVASNSVVPGTGNTTANASGATAYQYQIVAIDQKGGATIASTATAIANGAATLGFNQVNITSWSKSNGTVTVTTASAHNIVVGSMVVITGDPGSAGTWIVTTVADNTHFTYTTGQDTRNGATNVGGSTGQVHYYTCNHISWTAVTNAWKYLIYGRTAGSMALIGVSLPENPAANVHVDPLYNTFDDFGATLSAAPNVPAWYPSTPPVAVKNQDLITTILSGGGTVNVVLATTAGNTVAGAAATFDEAPNILTAAKTAAGVIGTTPGVLFFPQAPGRSYITNSVLAINFFPQVLSVMQAGSIIFGDTLIWGAGTWTGEPKVPTNAPSFSFESLPVISVAGNPGIYTINAQTNMSYVSLVAPNGNQAHIYLNDMGGGIPSGRWEHMSFATNGANDCMGRGLTIRDNINGGANFNLAYLTFATGTCPSFSDTPIFQNTQGGSPWSLSHIFLNHRGLYFGGGFLGTIETIYEQAAFMPKIIFQNSVGGQLGLTADLRISSEDTTQAQVIAYFGGLGGYVRFIGSNAVAGFPTVSGPGGIIFSFEIVGPVNANQNQNMGTKIGPQGGQAIDGILGTGAANNYPEEIFNMGVGIGAPYKVFVNSVAQQAPTCAVSAGGSVTPGAYTFNVAPVFADGGEGSMSTTSATCTTSSGQQTVTINWTAVPGVTGYDLYENGAAFQCFPAFVSGSTLSYVWTSFSPCGPSRPLLSASGPTGMTAAGVVTPQIKVESTNSSGVDTITMPTATANRAQSLPDAAGTFLLDTTLPLQSVFANPSVYDNFNRANGGVGSNWTPIGGGTFNVSGNQFVTISAGNLASFWNANTFNADQFSQVTIGTVGQMGAAVRVSVGGNYYACLELAGALVIQRLVSSVFNNLASTVVTPVTGDILRAEVIGQSPATINCWRNGVLALTATDSNLTAGQPGIYTGSSAGSVDNWSGGNIHPLAKLDVEQDFTQPLHVTTALTVGTPAPIPGSLALSTAYLQNIIGGAGTSDFSGVTLFKGRVGAGLTTTVNGDFGYDTTNKNWHFWTNGADRINAIWSAVPTTGNCVQANVVASVVLLTDSGSTNCGGTGAWSALTNATGNLTLANAGFTSTFNQTSGVNWTWANITAATNVASQSSPIMNYCGTYWTGAASAADCWLLQNVVGNGTNGPSTLTITHTGSPGTLATTLPGSLSLGTSPPTCGASVTGCYIGSEASTPAGAANADTIRANSITHTWVVNENNVGEMTLTKTFYVSVAPVTANANVTTDQNLMAVTVPANTLNIVNRTLRIQIAGVYSTAAASTASLTFKVKLCTVSGCGSGTVVNLINIGTPALSTVSASNKSFNLFAYSTTQTAGATSNHEAHGNLSVDLNTTTGQPVATLPDTNVSTVGTIDTTGTLFLQVTGAFSAASASNSFTQRQMTIEVLN